MIKKLETDELGRYEFLDVVSKLNEVIEFLNGTFLTQDSDCIKVGSLDSLSCDILTPLTNELSSVEVIDTKTCCPNCGARHFSEGVSTTTCVYYQPIWKDGVNINPDRNKTTTSYTCLECGHTWSVSR